MINGNSERLVVSGRNSGKTEAMNLSLIKHALDAIDGMPKGAFHTFGREFDYADTTFEMRITQPSPHAYTVECFRDAICRKAFGPIDRLTLVAKMKKLMDATSCADAAAALGLHEPAHEPTSWTPEELAALRKDKPPIVFNRIKPLLDKSRADLIKAQADLIKAQAELALDGMIVARRDQFAIFLERAVIEGAGATMIPGHLLGEPKPAPSVLFNRPPLEIRPRIISRDVDRIHVAFEAHQNGEVKELTDCTMHKGDSFTFDPEIPGLQPAIFDFDGKDLYCRFDPAKKGAEPPVSGREIMMRQHTPLIAARDRLIADMSRENRSLTNILDGDAKLKAMIVKRKADEAAFAMRFHWALELGCALWPSAEWRIDPEGMSLDAAHPDGEDAADIAHPDLVICLRTDDSPGPDMKERDRTPAEVEADIREQMNDWHDERREFLSEEKKKRSDAMPGQCDGLPIHAYTLTRPNTLTGMRNLARDVLVPEAKPKIEPFRCFDEDHLEHAFSIGPSENRLGRRNGLEG